MSAKRTRTRPRPVPVQRPETSTRPNGCMIPVPLNGDLILCYEVPFPGWVCPHQEAA